MNFEIKHRIAGAVLFTAVLDDAYAQQPYRRQLGAAVRQAYLQGADLQGAYLQGADLQGAYLQGAYLQGADLQGAYLQGAYLQGADLQGAKWSDSITVQRTPLFLEGLHYRVVILDEHMAIGCQTHSLSEWASFDDRAIAGMDGLAATKFWRKHKEALLALAASDGRSAPVAVTPKP